MYLLTYLLTISQNAIVTNVCVKLNIKNVINIIIRHARELNIFQAWCMPC